MSHICNGHPAQLRVREPQYEGSVVHVVQDVLDMHFGGKPHDESLGPGASQVVSSEGHQAIKPLPEGKVPIWQRLPAELGPGYLQNLEVILV